MYNRNDPRFRRTLNHISSNLESANETAQVGLFSLTEHCLKPCFLNLSNCLQQSGDACLTCFPRPDERQRHLRRTRTGGGGRAGGRLEHSFDFYDDWEQDENEALLAWGNDEYERLLGEENQGAAGQREPARRGIMNYGSAGAGTRTLGKKTRSAVLPYDGREDPTIIPNQSYFGFLDRLPFKIGGRGLKYKPSAADLKERPRDKGRPGAAIGSDTAQQSNKKHTRERSNTSSTSRSGGTDSSYSSRGDIYPSDEEEDAVPLDDEFAIALDRRTDDSNSGKTKKSRRRRDKLARNNSSRSSRPSSKHSKSSSEMEESSKSNSRSKRDEVETPSLSDLKGEEQQIREEEEDDVEMKREAAGKLALERGLDDESKSASVSTHAPVSSDAISKIRQLTFCSRSK